MEDYKMIVAGLIGSIVTIAIKAIIDFCNESKKHKRELRKLLFQRKTDAVERAISWYQEAIDCYMMLQTACDEVNQTFNLATWSKLITSTTQANRLYQETNSRLNQIYLYYDFSDIEEKNGVVKSSQYINYALTEISKHDQQVRDLKFEGATDDSDGIKALQIKAIFLFKELSKALDNQISSIVEIQNKLRNDYKSYLK